MSELIDAFLKINENSVDECNFFFQDQRFFPGNNPYQTDSPYKKFRQYESSLELLAEKCEDKFKKAHKGTPYYFLGWLAYDMGDYETAFFYMDAAMSEDQRNFTGKPSLDWKTSPAAQFIFLEPKNGTAMRISLDVREQLNNSCAEFNNEYGASLSVDEIKDKFVKPKIGDNKHRTLITTLFCFLLEAKQNKKLIRLRSKDGGSITPFLSHWLKGSLIFETILRETYPTQTGTLNSVYNVLCESTIKKHLNYTHQNNQELDLVGIINYLKNAGASPKQDRDIYATYQMRNATAHTLLHEDILDEQSHESLNRAVLFSNLYAIQNAIKNGATP